MITFAEKIAAWALSDDTGISSQNIAKAALGQPVSDRSFYPLDISDLGRCLRLVHQVPEARRGVTALGQDGDVWAEIDRRWNEIVAAAASEGDLGTTKPRMGEYSKYPRTYAILQACQRARRA